LDRLNHGQRQAQRNVQRGVQGKLQRRTRERPPLIPELRIGPKIRYTRLLKGLTLSQVAQAAGCSESLLSKIENGRANPSLKMVHRVASALRMPVAGLFQQGPDPDSVVLHQGERPVVETDQVRRGEGVRLEAVIPSASGHLLSGYINHIEPGGGSAGEIQHEGEEFGYVLEGEVELKVAGRRYPVGKGDCFHFRSERPHSYRNVGKGKARILWLNTPPTF
jgi:transcriptional regulator with XRE-family HTH domain